MDEEQKLAEELERDFDRSDVWEDVPGEDQVRRSLGAQVTVRLDWEDAARLLVSPGSAVSATRRYCGSGSKSGYAKRTPEELSSLGSVSALRLLPGRRGQ